MILQNIAELVSLGLTPATVIMSLVVVYEWWPEVKRIVREGPQSCQDWFILGVFIAFLGSAFDNTWWGVAWSCSYLELPAKDWWFHNGVWSNIPFRQTAGAFAAYCHIRAAAQFSQRDSIKADLILRWTLVSGLVFIAVLSGLV